MAEATINDLKFYKLKFPRLIPPELIEAVKGRNFTPDQFYDNQEKNKGNPNNYLYALIDNDSVIQGYFWAIREWTGELYVNTFSIAKEFWGKGKFIDKVGDFLKDLVRREGISKVLWATQNERFFLKHGFKRSNIRLMEYEVDGSS